MCLYSTEQTLEKGHRETCLYSTEQTGIASECLTDVVYLTGSEETSLAGSFYAGSKSGPSV